MPPPSHRRRPTARPRAAPLPAPDRTAPTTQLILRHPKIPRRRLKLREGQRVIVGRNGADAHLQLEWDHHVSRRHTRLVALQGVLHVEDLGSRNGTYIDGERIRGEQLCGPGQSLVIGATRFEVLSAGDEANTDPTLTDAKPIANPSAAGRTETVAQRPATIDLAPPTQASARHTSAPAAPAPAGPAQSAVLTRLGRFIVDAEAKAYYRALELEPEASDDAVRVKLEHYGAFIAEAASLLGAEHSAPLKDAHRALDAMRTALLEQRVEYDFSVDIVRAEARWAEAQSGTGPSVEALRATWSRLFPQRITQAKSMATRAARLRKEGRLAEAVSRGQRALQDDPFSAELRDRVVFWQNLLSAQR